MATETIEVRGHIVDSLTLARVLDAILESGADYELVDVSIGKTNADTSHASILVRADDQAVLDALLDDLQVHGANRIAQSEAVTATVEADEQAEY